MLDFRICFIGDSFTLGVGDPECVGWVGRICRRTVAEDPSLHLTAYNLGVRRDTSSDIAARWCAETERRLPTGVDGRLIFSFGANDTTLEAGKLRVAAEDSLVYCRRVLTSAAARWPLLMIGPAPVADAAQARRICALSQAYADLCMGVGVPYLEIAAPLLAGGIWTGEAQDFDGAHPRAGGYTQLAGLIWNWAGWRSWFPPPDP